MSDPRPLSEEEIGEGERNVLDYRHFRFGDEDYARALATIREREAQLDRMAPVVAAAEEQVAHVRALRAAAIKAGAWNAGPHPGSPFGRLESALAALRASREGA